MKRSDTNELNTLLECSSSLIFRCKLVLLVMKNRLPDPSEFALLISKGNFVDSESARFQRLSASMGQFSHPNRNAIALPDEIPSTHSSAHRSFHECSNRRLFGDGQLLSALRRWVAFGCATKFNALSIRGKERLQGRRSVPAIC